MLIFKIKILIMYIILLIMYTLIYYFYGKNHFTNINNNWFVECLYFASNMSSSTGCPTIIPTTTPIKLIICTHQILCVILLGMLIIS